MAEPPAGTELGGVPSGAPPVSAVRRLRHRHIIDRLDYLRGLRRLAAEMTQADLARELGLTQPSISSALKSAAKIADPPDGFSGASVYEIAQRFTAGQLGRDALVDELSRWPGGREVDRGEWQPVDDEPESVRQLSKALRDGLLDESAYRAVLDQRKRLGRPSWVMPAAAASGE